MFVRIMEFGWILVILTVFWSFHIAQTLLDFQCLKCICETATMCVSHRCDPELCAKLENNHECSCGPFGITPSLWIAADKPILDEKGAGTELHKFKRCVETFPCSIWTMQNYMKKYAEDCDGNKLINCDDHVLIHTFGPNNCRNASLRGERLERYKNCMSRTEIINPGGLLRTTSTTVAESTSESSTKTQEGTSSSQPETQRNATKEDLELKDNNFDVFI